VRWTGRCIPDQIVRRRGEYPYVLLDGRAFYYPNRPLPTLADRLDLTIRASYVRGLSNDTMVVSYFDVVGRGRQALETNRCAWVIATLDGEPLAQLNQTHTKAYHPFVPVEDRHEAFHCHRESGLVIVKTRDAFFHFGLETKPACHPLDVDAKHKALRHARVVPMTCGGPPVLFHGKHHTLIVPRPFARAGEWPTVLADTIAGYQSSLRALRRQSGAELTHGRWIAD